MRFCDKVTAARKELKLSREQLSALTGISKRMLAYYELENRMPRKKGALDALAEALHTDAASLMNDEAPLVLVPVEHAPDEGVKQAKKIIEEVKTLYSGGTLSRQDMDAMMLAIQDAYWIARRKAAAHGEDN